jgi:hypothetical protein
VCMGVYGCVWVCMGGDARELTFEVYITNKTKSGSLLLKYLNDAINVTLSVHTEVLSV